MAIDDMLAKLKTLQAGFGLKLPSRLAAIDTALQDCRDQPLQHEHVETLHRLLHTIAGSAGTFGYDALGVRARAFEQEVKGWLTHERWSERDFDRLALLLPELQFFLTPEPGGTGDQQDAGIDFNHNPGTRDDHG